MAKGMTAAKIKAVKERGKMVRLAENSMPPNKATAKLDSINELLCVAETHAMSLAIDLRVGGHKSMHKYAVDLANEIDMIRELYLQQNTLA